MSKSSAMTDAKILAAIKSEHKWELKRGVLICFGIMPSSYDWDADKNSDPNRVYNWCCHILNGGEYVHKRGSAKLAATTVMNGSEQRFEILRDVLIVFTHSEWPEFTQRTYDIWRQYRLEKDGPPQSCREQYCIKAMRCYAVTKFKKNKQDYLSRTMRGWSKIGLVEEASKIIHENPNTIRSYCKNIDISLEWAKENEKNPDYQNLSEKTQLSR